MTGTEAAAAVVIVGAGHAGGSCAAFLRSFGFSGRIVLMGDEPYPPYQRPPLSKAWLKGEADAESLALRPLSFYAENEIEFRSDCTVTQIDRTGRRVVTSSGEAFSYSTLVVATGARPVQLQLPGASLRPVLELRTADDAERLKRRLRPEARVCIIGGGYIGLETAASARALGARPFILEREPRLLARVACPEVSEYLRGRHEKEGVEILLNSAVAGFEGEGDTLAAVRLADGRTLPCDVAVVGVGASPNDELARAAGLSCERGVIVDADARSVSDPDIFAIGDVSLRPMPIYDRTFRLESVPNALEQARQAAAAICGRPRPPAECPWQWSDQYDIKIQIAGYPFGAERRVVRGAPEADRFAVFHLAGARILCTEAINAPDAFMFARQVILTRAEVLAEVLADPSRPIREAIRSPAPQKS